MNQMIKEFYKFLITRNEFTIFGYEQHRLSNRQLKDTPPEQYVNGLFDWEDTDQPIEFWVLMEHDWANKLDERGYESES